MKDIHVLFGVTLVTALASVGGYLARKSMGPIQS
jgi:hypothetical protein